MSSTPSTSWLVAAWWRTGPASFRTGSARGSAPGPSWRTCRSALQYLLYIGHYSNIRTTCRDADEHFQWIFHTHITKFNIPPVVSCSWWWPTFCPPSPSASPTETRAAWARRPRSVASSASNQEEALVGAFSVIVKSSRTFGEPSLQALKRYNWHLSLALKHFSRGQQSSAIRSLTESW